MKTTRQERAAGFTLVELMVAMTVAVLVTAGTFAAVIFCQKSWAQTTSDMESARKASSALFRMVYGGGTNGGLRSATSIAVTDGTRVDYVGTLGLPGSFVFADGEIQNEYGSVLCDEVQQASFAKTGNVLTVSVVVVETNVSARFPMTNAMSTSVFLRND